jgi:hypothetical protein
MTGEPSWAAALQRLSINGTHLSFEELVDACLLLMLGERVHIRSPMSRRCRSDPHL